MLAIVGGALLVLGAVLPWITITTPGGTSGRVGMAGEDGPIFFVGGLLIAALGLWAYSGHPSAAPALLIVGGSAAGTGAFIEYSDAARAIEPLISDHIYSVGVGISFLFAGALMCVVAGCILWGRTKAVTSPASARDWLGGSAGVALLVLLLVLVIKANANTGDWWSHDGFSWCDRSAFCQTGLVVAAT